MSLGIVCNTEKDKDRVRLHHRTAGTKSYLKRLPLSTNIKPYITDSISTLNVLIKPCTYLLDLHTKIIRDTVRIDRVTLQGFI